VVFWTNDSDTEDHRNASVKRLTCDPLSVVFLMLLANDSPSLTAFVSALRTSSLHFHVSDNFPESNEHRLTRGFLHSPFEFGLIHSSRSLAGA
jgi:hypothetical protein